MSPSEGLLVVSSPRSEGPLVGDRLSKHRRRRRDDGDQDPSPPRLSCTEEEEKEKEEEEVLIGPFLGTDVDDRHSCWKLRDDLEPRREPFWSNYVSVSLSFSNSTFPCPRECHLRSA